MCVVRRVLNGCSVLALCNIVFLWLLPAPPVWARLALTLLAAGLFIWLNISPARRAGLPKKLKGLGAGCELLATAAVCTLLQTALCLLVWRRPAFAFSQVAWVVSIIISLLVLYIMAVGGGIRLFLSSGQLTVTHRAVFIALWWVPLANIVIFTIIFVVAMREYRFGLKRLARNRARQPQMVCRTRYPLLLVHGIFFRDWKQLNYWGRIPAELEANGAVIHYGRQQSAASVEASAEELRAHILQIVQETGCEKVNIIAHSKGGLDARYAISQLGMDRYVASLTTVNTPHQGCRFAKKALDNVPEGLVSLVTKNYNRLFTALGDDSPDFFSGVNDLTNVECTRLNGLMADREGVLYQSVGSRMKTAKSASFPLDIGHRIIHPLDGDNDGLVAVTSMPWGTFTMLQPVGRRGLSHADVIDLTRKDVQGFDVCEFYVGLVQGLRERGL